MFNLIWENRGANIDTELSERESDYEKTIT